MAQFINSACRSLKHGILMNCWVVPLGHTQHGQAPFEQTHYWWNCRRGRRLYLQWKGMLTGYHHPVVVFSGHARLGPFHDPVRKLPNPSSRIPHPIASALSMLISPDHWAFSWQWLSERMRRKADTRQIYESGNSFGQMTLGPSCSPQKRKQKMQWLLPCHWTSAVLPKSTRTSWIPFYMQAFWNTLRRLTPWRRGD